jgi:hypothetical protein
MTLSEFSTQLNKNTVRFSATYTFEQQNKKHDIWFEIPRAFAAKEFPVDAFIAIAYPMAVNLQEELKIEGSISSLLRRNLPKVIPKIGLHNPAVKITAKDDVPRKKKGRGTGQLFTLGIDSFYTLVRHTERRQRAPHFLIFVNGYDIQPISKKLLKQTNTEIQKTAEYFSCTALIVSTNLRAVSDPFMDWGRFHGAAIAAAGHLFSDFIHSLFFNSSTIHREKIAWGTSEIADGFWSTEALTCIPFGTDTERVKKVQKIVKSPHFPFIKHRLRVCWQNFGQPDAPFNCSHCEKCLRTQLSLKFFTPEELPTFEPLNLDDLEAFHIKNEDRYHWQAICALSLRYLGNNSETTEAIRRLLQRNKIPEKQSSHQTGWRAWFSGLLAK